MITKGKQLRVLLLEDSVADAELVNEILCGLGSSVLLFTTRNPFGRWWT